MQLRIELSGRDVTRRAERVTRDLRQALGDATPDVTRDVDPIAVVTAVFSGIGTAKSVWDWWQSRRNADPMKVTLVLDDGRLLDIDAVASRERLAELLEAPDQLPGDER